MIQKQFKEWCKNNHLSPTQIEGPIYEIGGKKFLLLQEKEGNICNCEYEIILNTFEYTLLKKVDYVLYLWGSRFMYTPVDVIDNPGNGNVHLLKHLGKTTLSTPGVPFLGIHGCYEILNGTRFYEDWVAKAKFLEIESLGICEKNTLAGVFYFQEACKKADIKSILGETITIKSSTEDAFYEAKVYATNETGWKNLLLINVEINVNNPSQFVTEEKLLQLSEGIVFVFSPMYFPYNPVKIKEYQSAFKHCYFQLDSVQYSNDTSDKTFLFETQKYLNNRLGLQPILICDAYYLDKEDYVIKPAINTIAGHRTLASQNQYFKTDEENMELFDKLFLEEDFAPILIEAIENLNFVADLCNYKIGTGVFKLPKYVMSEEDKKNYGNAEEMFFALLGTSIAKLTEEFSEEKRAQYYDRLQTEVGVIMKGGFIDYFLILYDIIKWCKSQDILVGLGRGSAAGALTAYLLDITKVDPLEYGLLFERFLNEGRIQVTTPDIDTDFESNRRDDVKKYMEEKYGHDKVCSIGTYTTLQMRAVFRDFCKLENVPVSTVEYLSKIMFETRDNKNARASKASWEYIFRLASRNATLLQFVQEHAEMIEKTWLCHAHPRAASVHPCATLILPENESIFTSIPIRQGEVNGTKMIVSEWEGPALEKAGYLKEDILGISQLDKFRMIVNLVKENYGEDVVIYDLPLKEPEVFEMFTKGQNGDVFHLGSKGLTAYCTQVKPTSVPELCAMLALYRPGPMEGNFHNEYVQLKNGQRQVEYMPGLEEITQETFGLLAYQEQIMQITVTLASFTLVEADNIRKGMGKVDRKFFAEQGEKFMEGALKNGFDKTYLEELWHKMCSFGGYAFNKSHALCYAITGYYCQYLKWKYPLPYWITALEFATDDTLLRYIAEINKAGKIKILGPDINRSKLKFFADFKTQEIIWSISKVKQCGEVAVSYIFDERDKNGEFFSFEEFLSRVDKSKVNKSVVENLILAGAFDILENIEYPSQRKLLIYKYREVMNTKVDKEKDWFIQANIENKLDLDWWWLLQQKRVSGLAFFNYPSIVQDFNFEMDRYVEIDDFQNTTLSKSDSRIIVTGGVVSEIEIKSSKKGDYCRIRLEQNYSFIWVTIWSDYYPHFEKLLSTSEGKIMIVKARGYCDSYKSENALQSDENMEIQILE